MKRTEQILIIDDDSTSRAFVTRVLGGGGYTVLEARNLTAGIESARQQVPHLIILDLLMPEGSGFDFLEQRRNIPELSQIPVLVLSGLSDKKSIYKATALGAAEYVQKPVDARILIQKVRKLLINREFMSVTFEEESRPKAKMHAQGRIVIANEIGFLLEAPVRVSTDTQLNIQSVLLDQLGCTDCVFQKTRNPSKSGHPGLYLNEIAAVGLSEAAIKKIREITRGWG